MFHSIAYGEIILILAVVFVPRSKSHMLCPSGYWPAKVNTSGGLHGTQRTFDLPYMSSVSEPMCKFCPNVGCYVFRRPIEAKVEKPPTKSTGKTTLAPTTTTPIASMTGSSDSTEYNVFGSPGTNGSASGNTSQSESAAEHKLYMSCDYWGRLPPPENIVSYLDCVMIGTAEEYYLFLYEPRFQASPVPIVDCVDADFLAWIPNGTQLLGLELGFRMRKIPPFLFRYHQRIMQLTQYICIDGSSLANKSIPFADTERFASNKLTQVVFRSTSLVRSRRPPEAPDMQYTTDFQSEEKIAPCPHIVQHKPANITPTKDCQFSPGALPTTSDRVDQDQALQRCPFRIEIKNIWKTTRRRKPHTGLVEELKVPPAVLSACLLVLVLLLTIGIIIAFCVMNAEKLMLCRTRSRKRREREAAIIVEQAEQAAKEAAALLIAEEEKRHNAWHPIYGRQGFVPPTMGGAFGAFTMRTMDAPPPPPQQGMYGGMGGNTGEMPRFN